jgi:hypothetical protein
MGSPTCSLALSCSTARFNPLQLRDLPIYEAPVAHLLLDEQVSQERWPFSFPPQRVFKDLAKKQACFPVRPPPKVDGNMWVILTPPYDIFGHRLETVFLHGGTISSAKFLSICETSDSLGSLHVNWPLARDSASDSTRRHLQCKVHRLLAFTFFFRQGVFPFREPYAASVVVDHNDKNHQNSLLNNLRLMTAEDHDRLARKRPLPTT